MEIWSKIENFSNYEVSNIGRLKSYKGINPKILKGGINKGYQCFNMIDDVGQVYYKPVHRLVAEYFVDNEFNLEFVNHEDKNKLNNRFDNLKWCNIRENNTHMRLTMVRTSKYTGVYFDKSRNKYYSTIKIDGKVNFLGRFIVEEDARDAYLTALSKNNLMNRYASNDSI